MIELAQHIETLLLENDCVIVPGFGGFVAHYSPATRVKEENIFLPPTRTIGFNPQLKLNDGVLVQSYMSAYDTSFADASRIVEKEVNEFIGLLHEEGKAHLDNIGEIHYNIYGNYEFVPYDYKITTPSLYGLDSFEIHELATLQQKEKVLIPANLTREKKTYEISINRAYLRNAVAMIAAVILFFAFSNRVENDEILHNVYETVNGEALPGRGVVIGSYYCIGRYQNVIVLTDKGGARLSAITMQKTFDMSTLVLDLSSWKPESYIFWQYYWSPGRFGYDAIVSNGRFYEYSAIRSTGFTTYTEPILKDGLTYKASPYAPKWFDYYQGILYDEIGGRFLGIEKNTWILKELAVATTTQPFDWGNMHASLRYMETGYNNYEYGLFEDWDTKKMTLCVFNFDTKPNIGVGKYPADNCPELEKAKYFAVGSLGPVFLYATDRDIYRYDYNGTNTGEKLYTLAQADEKITGMKIFKPCIHRFIPNHPYNNKVLILSTYNESKKEGKIYMYYINEVNGMIDIASEKVFEGFGEILDMEYNYPKYGT